jgi:hypothetical protein
MKYPKRNLSDRKVKMIVDEIRIEKNEMINMKTVATRLLILVGILQACTGDQAPAPDPQQPMESVSLVLYYSDGDFDVKTTGEKALLNTGELVTVQRRVIRPDGVLLTGDWNGKFLNAINAPPSDGTLELKLDRANGMLCNRDRCAYVYAICPAFDLLKAGTKCHSYRTK